MDDDTRIRSILEGAKTIAVLGASPKPARPAHYVPAYLHGQGYVIYPVNPLYVGMKMFGHPVVSDLTELDTPIDLVDVFRRSTALPGHLDEILAMEPRPSVVWFQLGIRNDEVAATLRHHGIEVVQDRCTLADHQRLF